MTDILDLIDGALEDYTVSADAARWVPDEAAREMANAPARWVTGVEIAHGAADGPTGVELWVNGDGTTAPDRDAWIAEMAEARRRIAATEDRWRGAWGQVFAALGPVIEEFNRVNAAYPQLGATIAGVTFDEAYGWASGHVHVARDGHVSPRCSAHQEPDEPTDPMQRALWLRRNRNTGPKPRPRAPRRIDARGSR